MAFMMKLSELCDRIIGLVDRMQGLAKAEDWTNFWVLNKERDALCELLQNGQHSPAEFRACREGLEVLLEKNNALQAEVTEMRQQYQAELSARRQQRDVASVYAQQQVVNRR